MIFHRLVHLLQHKPTEMSNRVRMRHVNIIYSFRVSFFSFTIFCTALAVTVQN